MKVLLIVGVLNFLSVSIDSGFETKDQSEKKIFDKISKSSFESLLRSKSFFAKCESYDHPVFKSVKYSVSYSDKNQFSETLYLFNKDDCRGGLSTLESKGTYDLGKSLASIDYPTRKIDYKYDEVTLRLLNKKVRSDLKSIYTTKCNIDLNKLSESFNISKESCFGINLGDISEIDQNLIGLATDNKGDELHLLSGLKLSKKRPMDLNYQKSML